MARKSKEFSELMRQDSSASKRSQQSFKLHEPVEETVSSSNFEEQEQRIGEIIGLDEDDNVKDVNLKTLATYLSYLKQQLECPFQLTGSEDFSWEERFVFGYGSKREHDRLRKTNPSYLDTYEFLHFQEDISEWDGLQIFVQRVSDQKEFLLALADLEVTDQTSKNYQLIDDYTVWFVNWR